MLVPELIKQAYQAAVGEAEPPAEGTENYKLLFNSANILIGTWQNEKRVNWNSLWGRITLEEVVSTSSEYAIDKTVVRKLSSEENGVQIACLNGEVVDFKVVKPSQLYKGGRRVAHLKNGKIKFAEAFKADDPCIGGTISFSYFGYAPKLINSTSEVPVDQPEWLVFMVAAEFARNDYTKQNQAPGLIAQAAEVMESMIADNEEEEDATIDHGDYSPLSETT